MDMVGCAPFTARSPLEPLLDTASRTVAKRTNQNASGNTLNLDFFLFSQVILSFLRNLHTLVRLKSRTPHILYHPNYYFQKNGQETFA